MTTATKGGEIISVDDNLPNQKVITSVLSKEGYAVKAVMDGPSAFEAVREDQPDLVLLDIMMPGMNGYEVIEQLKQHQETRHIPVIFVTAKDQPKDLEAGFAAGAVDYVGKPFSFEELKARVNAQMHVVRQRAELEDMQRQLEKLNGELFDFNIEATQAGSKLRRQLEEMEAKMAQGSGDVRSILRIAEAASEIAQMPITLLRLMEEGQSRDLKEFCGEYARRAEALQEDLKEVLGSLQAQQSA